jgi:hypothetical protein
MPILTIQRRQLEVGRIRIGDTKETVKNGRTVTFPVKRETFGFTTASRALAGHIQALYGGVVAEWEPHGGGTKQWEVITEAKALAVIVPPNSVSQWYEMWSGGGCVRRCDGERNVLTDVACECPPDPGERSKLASRGNACKPTTRVNVMLADVPGIGVWRLETHGFYAATELPAVAELLAAGGGYIPARLELQERSAKRPKDSGAGTETRRWMVPVLHVDASPTAMLSGNAPRIELAAGDGAQAAVGGRDGQHALPAAPGADDEFDDEFADEMGEATAHETAGHYRLVAEHAKTLAEVQQAWRDAKAVGVLDAELAAYLRERGDTFAPKATTDEPAAAEADADEPDADQAWQALVDVAGEHVWTTSYLEQLVIDRFGKSSDECNGWQLGELLTAIRNGEVQ